MKTKTVLSEKTRNNILETIRMYYASDIGKKLYDHNGFDNMSPDELIKHLLAFYRY